VDLALADGWSLAYQAMGRDSRWSPRLQELSDRVVDLER
jgi:hypothetical protein